jgi:hypothetical protein
MAESEAAGDTTERSDTGDAARPGRRQRSAIQFPYGDLDDALEVVRAIHSNGGLAGSPDQVAFWMSSTTKSGAYRTKLAAARLFGVIRSDAGNISLTPLGRQVVDPSTARAAKALAFGKVPLFRALYAQYHSGVLPPDNALESAIQAIGVPAKQRGRARQTFQRSAEQAGVLSPTKDRLVLPPGVTTLEEDLAAPSSTAPVAPTHDTHPSVGRHPLIEGLISTLPPEGKIWPRDRQEAWLELAKNVFALLYPVDRGRETD